MTTATSNGKQAAQVEPGTIDWFERYLADNMRQLESVCTKAIGPARILRLMCTELRRKPEILQCRPETVLLCLIDCAAMGVEPGREAHFIPFNESYEDADGRRKRRLICNLIVDYKGLVAIALRSPNVAKIDAEVVYRDDFFKYEKGDKPFIKHVPNDQSENRRLTDITHAYVVAHLTNGHIVRDVMTVREIEAIRLMSAFPDGPVWNDEYTGARMARKCPIRRIFDMLPLSSELKECVVVADRTEFNFDGRPRALPASTPGRDVVFTQPAQPASVPVDPGQGGPVGASNKRTNGVSAVADAARAKGAGSQQPAHQQQGNGKPDPKRSQQPQRPQQQGQRQQPQDGEDLRDMHVDDRDIDQVLGDTGDGSQLPFNERRQQQPQRGGNGSHPRRNGGW